MRTLIRWTALGWVSVLSGFSGAALAWDSVPQCIEGGAGRGTPLPVMNDTVLNWKQATPNQYTSRAYVLGRYIRTLRVRPSHVHFELSLGGADAASPAQSVELVYNREFGEMPPEFAPNSEVAACGDYITSNAPAGRYEASPMGAIFHWVHYNPGNRDGGKHPHGFVWVGGKLFGQERGAPRERGPSRGRSLMEWLSPLLPEFIPETAH